MLEKRSIQWLFVFAGLIIAGAMAYGLLWAQGLKESAQWVGMIFTAVAAGWIAYGLWTWKGKPWVQQAGFLGLLATVVAALGFALRVGGWPNAEIIVAGVWAMGGGFALGLWLIRRLLSLGHPVFGVARTVVDEAVRMKIVTIFIVIILIVIPMLPFFFDPHERLEYRIQSFLTYALGGASLVLGLMTVFLGCATITSEIDKKRIYMTMAKPVGRGQYVLGKWLGIALLNVLLVFVTGVGVYAFTKVLQAGQAQGDSDRWAVEQEVLVARASSRPVPPAQMNFGELVEKRIAQLKAEHPQLYGHLMEGEVPPQLRQSAVTDTIAAWHTIGPLKAKTYVFPGLENAHLYGPTVQLRMKPRAGRAPPDDLLLLMLRVAGENLPLKPLSNDHFHVINLPVQAIDDQGRLTVSIANINYRNPQRTFRTSISFTPNEGLEVLYTVGTFEGNLLRALGVIAVQLSFIAMLSLLAGSFLSFPTACLFTLLIFVSAFASGFVGESLEFYASFGQVGDNASTWDKLMAIPARFTEKLGEGDAFYIFKLCIKLVGSAFMGIVPPFSEYQPVTYLSEGRVISLAHLSGAVLWLGLVWTGAAGLLAWFFFRRRELAQVTV